jgi:HD-GYP domain-containing protein (c-di-GMP phosphodiesterase class II)
MMGAPGLLSADEAARLEVAALLHDVGKIGIPDSILLKPGPLTEEEWQIMRHHDQVGADLALVAGISSDIVTIMAGHHAVSFAGEEMEKNVPTNVLSAVRLLCIADSYDAMTSDRPYRKRMSREDGVAELRRCAGKQFDRGVVEHFIAALEAVGDGSSPRVQSPREAA